MIVDADNKAYNGYPYHVLVGLKNVADIPVYNPEVELLENGRKNYIYQPQERLTRGPPRSTPARRSGPTTTALSRDQRQPRSGRLVRQEDRRQHGRGEHNSAIRRCHRRPHHA